MRALPLLALVACASEPERGDGIPIGYDAYRELDALPRVRIGDRAYMRSTYDRTGANEAADASHYLRQDDDGTYVTMDVAGTGYLAFARANHWHGSPWHYRVDGIDHVVRERDDHLEPANAFPAALAPTWQTTQGADVSWVPMPFEQSLSVAHELTHYGTGYYIVHLLAEQPVHTWHEEPAPFDVLGMFTQPLDPPGEDVEGTDVLELAGPGTIRELAIDAPVAIEGAHLVVHWDGRAQPSIDAPVPLVFGAGTLTQQRGTIVDGMLARVVRDGDRLHATLRFPMPFAAGARIELAGARLRARVVHGRGDGMYLHATYVDHGVPVPGEDLAVLDTSSIEGEDRWCGTFNGMSFTFSDRGDLGTLEGDPRMFFDDARSPQGQGTGTEEWAAGGDYWHGGQIMTLPLAGHPTGAPLESAYRMLIADAMPFGARARIQLEHGGSDESTEHYTTVAYWYGRPGACLVLTDTLELGDPDDEARHHYKGGGAYLLTARWDGGDTTETTHTVRTTRDASEFTLAIDPANRGVLLRRTLDAAYADQRALVWIAADEHSVFELAGTWYTAGSTSVVFSDPPGELDPGEHAVEIAADRRWRDDELLLPPRLTEGRAAIRVHVQYTGAPHAMFPGGPTPPGAWTEARYQAYSYVL
jgi:D-arabinan exo alpha-(1,3)/(1,5)-arabinofuranosidase (non-reducing end)